MVENSIHPRKRLRSPWSCSLSVFLTTGLAISILFIMASSVLTRQLDQKGCSMSYMWPAFAHFADFDTEYSRLAKKYSLYLYREVGIDEDTKVQGIPVLFVPGNAGSYKQARAIASQAAVHYRDFIRDDGHANKNGKRPLDFFSVDFNEDFAAFHGQTLLDQAEYLNDAISYILALYHKPHRSIHDPNLPRPTSVILVGHSMGGVVARIIFTLANYQIGSINTLITLATPHARPPISFDEDIVKTYKLVNDYWRNAFSQQWAMSNPLWHVTVISIAGGGLDTIVPSDYSTLASIVPPSHGFAVFTSTMPEVWTGMDHLAITWCDQLRKNIVSSLFNIVDARRSTQTTPRVDRMAVFKKSFLTGLEDFASGDMLQTEVKSLSIPDQSIITIPSGERLTLGRPDKDIQLEVKTYVIPIPSSNSNKTFRLLTDKNLAFMGNSGSLEVFICRTPPSRDGQSSGDLLASVGVPKDASGTMNFSCKNAAPDAILLPASTPENKQPFDHYLVNDLNHLVRRSPPFKFLQYDVKILANYEFITVINHVHDYSPGWVVAEFASRPDSETRLCNSLTALLVHGLEFATNNSSILSEIYIPCIRSSLLAYKIRVNEESVNSTTELFNPLLRQHTSDLFESKFFVNAKEVDISFHGVAPYIPTTQGQLDMRGLSIQLWADPTNKHSKTVTLKIDVIGSVGKLWMRFRAVFAIFPLIIVALVFQRQLSVYNETGSYMSFSGSICICMRGSIPMLFLGLTLFFLYLAGGPSVTYALTQILGPQNSAIETLLGVPSHDLLLGLQDPFFWYLIPLFGIISVGICVVVNYGMLVATSIFAFGYGYLPSGRASSDRSGTGPNVTPVGRQMVIAVILLFLVATVIPYQFVFVVLCVVQIVTCVRALCLARETHTLTAVHSYNYAHSILMLMFWILPINLPTLVVWVHNLAVHWLAPFSSHHNILAITPLFLLVGILNTGSTIPRVQSPLRYVTSSLLLFLALFTAVYGVSFAYTLHSIVNFIFGWLAVIHLSAVGLSVTSLKRLSAQSREGSKFSVKKES